MNTSALVKSKAVFGDDANIFRPERWLEASKEKREEMENHLELIFGYGRWMCIGKNVAWMELYKTTFEVSAHSSLRLSTVWLCDFVCWFLTNAWC